MPSCVREVLTQPSPTSGAVQGDNAYKDVCSAQQKDVTCPPNSTYEVTNLVDEIGGGALTAALFIFRALFSLHEQHGASWQVSFCAFMKQRGVIARGIELLHGTPQAHDKPKGRNGTCGAAAALLTQLVATPVSFAELLSGNRAVEIVLDLIAAVASGVEESSAALRMMELESELQIEDNGKRKELVEREHRQCVALLLVICERWSHVRSALDAHADPRTAPPAHQYRIF